MANKQTYIAVALALVVVFLFFMLGFFGIGGDGAQSPADLSSTTDSNGPQAILSELNTTGTVADLRTIVNVQGEGEEAKSGDTVTVHYVGQLLDGTQFDSSRDRGTPFSFTIDSEGPGSVIAGWNRGLAGKKVGDRFILVIPPELGYGPAGAPGLIPPNATLIFEIELLGIESPSS